MVGPKIMKDRGSPVEQRLDLDQLPGPVLLFEDAPTNSEPAWAQLLGSL
jgi:hypothetical protein